LDEQTLKGREDQSELSNMLDSETSGRLLDKVLPGKRELRRGIRVHGGRGMLKRADRAHVRRNELSARRRPEQKKLEMDLAEEGKEMTRKGVFQDSGLRRGRRIHFGTGRLLKTRLVSVAPTRAFT